MEDEDGEGSNVDSWVISDQLSYKDAKYCDETLKKSANNVNDYIDGIEENKQEITDDKLSNSKVIYKGFKKRILAQTQENQMPEQITQELYPMASPKAAKDKNTDGKRGKITEYAQYLGLQPAGKYKCSMCHPTVSFRSPSLLKQHQCICLGAANPITTNIPGPSDHQQSTKNLSTTTSTSTATTTTTTTHSASTTNTNNFHITRKVYLCSACGTYFENWNLFLHMREIHKRHICLFCLGMFGQAERLSYHLSKKHSVSETRFTSIEDFYAVFKGSCYLICCTCEKVFSETDDFSSHYCNTINLRTSTDVCSVCRQTGGTHLPTCNLDTSLVERRDKIERIHASDTERTLLPNPANAVAKKLLNAGKARFRTNEKALLSSYQRKISDLYERKNNFKIRRHSDTADRDNELRVRHSRDKVTPGSMIMQVSKYNTNREDSRLVVPSDNIKERQIVEIDVTKSPVCERTFDRYTETIMQVSRCGEWDARGKCKNDDDNRINNLDDSLEEGEQGELILDDGRDDSSGETPPISPIPMICANSPLHDKSSSSSTKQPDNDTTPENNISDSTDKEIVPPVQESPTHSVTRINSSNRSLVIKICANKNSQFSVQTPNANGTYTNNDAIDDEDDEIESGDENNKPGDDEADKEISASDPGSDSDSGRLTVALSDPIDSRPNEEVAPVEQPISLDEEKQMDEETTETPETKETVEDPTVVESSIKLGELTDINVFSELPVDIESNDKSADIAVDDSKVEEDVEKPVVISDGIFLAASDIANIDLNVTGTLESMEIDDILKLCIEAASATCVYCNHARHIAVHGKQLALHMLAEHRFQPQHPAIIIQQDQFISRVKKSLDELESHYFNLDSYDTNRGTYDVPIVRTYECYLCRIYYTIHKELYLHNRKMHQKTILICIMCKSTFYNHSELLCHLCPGVYAANVNIRYRCCICTVESLPSAFRLMVHLRKRHHACDVCLESTGNQQKLSNHVWKHKLHHLCYRCGIAYRNKPDITKHLFWKHGTESVLCKKCLQKKWPHIYHFCIPPSAFVCEECGSTFSRAVALKVHKRLHSGDLPYSCSECPERFISKKLAAKHENSHKPQPEISPTIQEEVNEALSVNTENTTFAVTNETTSVDANTVDVINSVPKETPVRKVVDVYDLPPLNLSSDSESDTDNDKQTNEKNETEKPQDTEEVQKYNDNIEDDETDEKKNDIEISTEEIVEESVVSELNDNTPESDEVNDEQKKEEVVIMNGIWDNFKSYKASLESKDSSFDKVEEDTIEHEELIKIITAEHDYCIIYSEGSKDDETPEEPQNIEMKDADSPTLMNSANNSENDGKKKIKSPKKKKQQGDGANSSSSSDSSSDSDSSSCSCGTNCSCSSSSSGSSSSSSSSSDSDSSTSESSPRKQSAATRKDRRKERDAKRNKIKEATPTIQVDGQPESEVIPAAEIPVEPIIVVHQEDEKPIPPPITVRESDLETTETETDEDFYDEYPQQNANKLLAEKRNQLMLLAAVAPSTDNSTLGTSSIGINNGTMDTLHPDTNSLPASVPSSVSTPVPSLSVKQSGKRKIKTKRRKKTGEETNAMATNSNKSESKGRGRGRPPGTTKQHLLQQQQLQQKQQTTESIKLNIPKFLYKNKQIRSSSPKVKGIQANDKKFHPVNYQVSHTNARAINQSINATAKLSGNENENTNHANENKRFSKRKRIPKKFYGDSSDEEQRQSHHHTTQKWRRVEQQQSPIPVIPYIPSITIKQNFGPPPPQATVAATPSAPVVVQSKVYSTPPRIPEPPIAPVIEEPSISDSEEAADSSSDSSASDSEQQQQQLPSPQPQLQQPPGLNQSSQAPQPAANHSAPTGPPAKSTNLYCFCQCPYDEVSEMIACDGDNCRIEWFHFECVGIMVPPKGKWYCPNCRKADSSLPENEYYE